MKKDEKHVSLRIDPDLLRKFTYVAKYDDRSLNWMLLHLIRDCVAQFEQEHGKIPSEDMREKEFDGRRYHGDQKSIDSD